jgi:hypothetical protein
MEQAATVSAEPSNDGDPAVGSQQDYHKRNDPRVIERIGTALQATRPTRRLQRSFLVTIELKECRRRGRHYDRRLKTSKAY